MKRLAIALACAFAASAAFAQIPAVSVPNSFTSGQAISSSLVNADFAALVQAVKDQVEPIGSVIASFVAPDASGDYMSGTSNLVWAFADGTKPSGATGYTGPFPDMRGQFIRGMNGTRSDGHQDPDTRSIGVLQSDALKAHRHTLLLTSSAGAINTALGIQPSWAASYAYQTTFEDMTGDGSVFATETRPTNVAVYWYIKVK